MVWLRVNYTNGLLAASIQVMVSQIPWTVRLQASSGASYKPHSFLGSMISLGPLPDPQFSKVLSLSPYKKKNKCPKMQPHSLLLHV